MIIRVATSDAESAQLLAASLTDNFGGEHVSLRTAGDVQVELNGDSGRRAMEETFSSVERWLDGRQYRLEV